MRHGAAPPARSPPSVHAQPATRRATNIAALARLSRLLPRPPDRHRRQGRDAQQDGQVRVADDDGSIRVVFKGSAPDGLDEIRGEFWDLGRMKADEPRLGGYDLQRNVSNRPGRRVAAARRGDGDHRDRGGARGAAAGAVDPRDRAQPDALPRSEGHNHRTVLRAQSARRSAGRAGARAGTTSCCGRRTPPSGWSTCAAAEGQGVRPRARRAHRHRPLAECAARCSRRAACSGSTPKQATLALAKPPTETTTDEEPIRVPAGPPPEVVFSAPTEDETDVLLGPASGFSSRATSTRRRSKDTSARRISSRRPSSAASR